MVYHRKSQLKPKENPHHKKVRFERAGNKCEICHTANSVLHPVTGAQVILKVLHIDNREEHYSNDNLICLCQHCQRKLPDYTTEMLVFIAQTNGAKDF